MRIVAIDLFAGGGGFTEGWIQGGGEVALAIDNWPEAIETHRLNHPDVPILNMELGGSIRDLCRVVYDHLPDGEYHLHIHGSPPCQELSNASTHDSEDGMRLVCWFLDFVETMSPDSWSMENVRPLAPRLAEMGVPHQIIDATDFGVAQRRVRCFAGEGWELKPTTDKVVRVVDVLPHLDRHHLIPQPSMVRRWRFLSVYDAFPTITSQSPGQIRVVDVNLNVRWLTIGEIAGIQGWHTFLPPDLPVDDARLIVGNMVCPPIAEEMVRSIGGWA